ncbi:ADC synthase [Chaetomium strumarium]|uniref:aminodeoxychorismate synthase n=1 Tax=Chaetomium strumarium TaxID=1170767 RepID=A0AAJ0GZA8_9PEZI|nr:ADC synthase [Chaetomium strumarium]
MRRPRILFLDAHDSFSNNITSLLTTLLEADVSVLAIDDPLLLDDHDTVASSSSSSSPAPPSREERFVAELRRYDALVCGPGPGHPDNGADVGLMGCVWRLAESEMLPVLGVCLGFQSLVSAHGGRVGRLRRGLHGMVREIVHRGDHQDGRAIGDIFRGVGRFRATLYHSLCGDIGQNGGGGGGVVGQEEWEAARWRAFDGCPDLLPLAWAEEEREDGRKERILMAVKHRTKPFWGVQYHPESVCTEEEGNKVVLNWFREAQRWNESRERTAVTDGHGWARAATKASLLSQQRVGSGHDGGTEWLWEYADALNPVLRSQTVPLRPGLEVPDIVEAIGLNCSEQIILDSSNAASETSRADVRGRYSIIAVCLDEATRIEYHVGDAYATISVRAVGGSAVVPEQVSLARYGSIWGLLAHFHEARRMPVAESSSTPFIGGFMGYITYEQGLSDIGVPIEQPRAHRRPDVFLAWVHKSIVVDHELGLIHVQHLSARRGDKRENWVGKTADKLRSLHRPRRRPSSNSPEKTRRPSMSASVQPPQTKEYEAKVKTCQEYIAAGESYELCLTDQTTLTRPLGEEAPHLNPVSVPHPRKTQHQQQQQQQQREQLRRASPSWTLFKRLRKHQPAPFASYLRIGSATLVSASPERFLTYDHAGLCSMRPMKGTVRKSEAVPTLAEAERILHVPKEEAENLMIVDLVRHDLHGVCGAGNVTVPKLLAVEEYQSVFQMITVVEGQLPSSPPRGGNEKGKYTGLDVLAASLPPGSMTGAPKKRSCEILREIEGHKERGLYSGVVGYMCATGRGDWSVTIRSLFRYDDEQVVVNGEDGRPKKHEVWRIGAGGAVTILSTPEGEREEMFTKLAGPLRVFGEEACR